MVGAINFLRDAKLVCDNQKGCDGCPCANVCKVSGKFTNLPDDELWVLVNAVTQTAAQLKAGKN